MWILIWVSVLGYTMKELDLLDIDTLRIKNKRFGRKESWSVRQKVCGRILDPVGSSQTLITHKDKSGKFGRILGDFQIYDGEEDRNMGIVEYMIKHNIGVEYTGQSKQQIEEHHLQNRKYLKS